MIDRNYPSIYSLLKDKHSLMVFGPRGTGKTSLLTGLIQEFSHFRIIDLLDSQLFQRYLVDPSLLYKEVENELSDEVYYVMIDEVQLLPELLNEIHRCFNNFENRVAFLLTGSSARKLKRNDANLLAGRTIKKNFFALNSTEIDYQINFSKVMNFGCLPKIHSIDNDEFIVDYLKTYVGTYLQEEIKKESEVRKLDSFSRFLEFAATHNGQPVNFSKTGRAASIHAATAKEYYEILLDTLLAYELPIWSHSVKVKMQQASKYYLFDNGIVNALTGELRTELNKHSYRYGNLFESLVVTELFKLRELYNCDCKMYYYRDLQGREIDLIFQRNSYSLPVAIEIKSNDSPSLADVKNLVNFKKNYPKSRCIVLCNTVAGYKEDDIEFLPYLQGAKEALTGAG